MAFNWHWCIRINSEMQLPSGKYLGENLEDEWRCCLCVFHQVKCNWIYIYHSQIILHNSRWRQAKYNQSKSDDFGNLVQEVFGRFTEKTECYGIHGKKIVFKSRLSMVDHFWFQSFFSVWDNFLSPKCCLWGSKGKPVIGIPHGRWTFSNNKFV